MMAKYFYDIHSVLSIISGHVVGFDKMKYLLTLEALGEVEFDSPTSQVISDNPLVEDFCEASNVYVSGSQWGSDAGEGLFARKDIEVCILVYPGIC